MIYYAFFIPFILLSIISIDNSIVRPFNKLLIPWAIILMVLFLGSQSGISDYISYKEMYHNYSFDHFNIPFYKSYSGDWTGHEYIYVTLSILFHEVGIPFSVFFLLLVFITSGVKLIWLRKHSSFFFISFLIYMAFIAIKDMYVIRAQIATSIVFLSAHFIVDKKPVKYTLAVLLASGFHIFSITALPIYLLYKMKLNRRGISVLLISTLVIIVSGGLVSLVVQLFNFGPLSFVANKLLSLKNDPSNNSVNPFGIGALFYFIVVIYGLLKWSDITENKVVHVIFMYFLYGFLGFLLFSDLSLLAYRTLEMYSHLALAIILPFYISVSNYSFKWLIYLVTVIYSLFFLIVKINATPEYNNILFG